MRILIVEDEPKIARFLERGLSEEGHRVEVADDLQTARRHLADEAFDLWLVDRMLPDGDGLSLIRERRRGSDRTPAICLTARDRVEERVEGLIGGADDYLVKPFAFSELLARCRTLLRRGKMKEPETLQIADLELDLMRRRVTRAGRRIDLTAKEFALLELLLRRQGEVLPRSLIASPVWDLNFDSDTNVIEVAMRRLRAKIDDDFEPKLIRTVRGMGYVLENPETT